MSYEEPTRRVPGQQPAQPTPPVRPHDDLAWREDLIGRLSSLRTALALVALLAAVALGLSVYALVADEDDGGAQPRGVSSERVAELEERVDRLDGRVDDRATEGQLEELRGELEAIEQRVEEGGDEQADEQLRQDLDALRQRVEEFEQQPPSPPTTTP